jgi:sporulation protein YlmC with PRC-barrel domain
MRLHYHDLVGKSVVTSDGHRAGRVADLVAAPRGGTLRVTALRIGTSALIRRISFSHARRLRLQPREIPWGQIAHIDDRVHLRLTSAELTRLPKSLPSPAYPVAPPE